MLNKLHVTIHCINVLSRMPMHAKVFKEILSKKRKIDEHETTTLGEECSVADSKQASYKA